MTTSRTALVFALLLTGCDATPKPGPPSGSAATGSAIAGSTAKSASSAPSTDPFAGRIVDLTHPFDAETIYWPTETGFEFKPGNNGRTLKGYYYAANRFAAPEHGGTHLDAPIHFSEAKPTAEALDVNRLVGPAAVINVVKACDVDPDYQVSVADLESWEERNRRQLVDVIVLLRTGWDRRWPDRVQYLGTERRGPEALAELRFPGLAPEAARWLVEHRAIKAIGIDTASIDYGRTAGFESHVILCGNGVPIFENVMNLQSLPEQGATVVALPMKIAGGSGGPLRIIGIVRN
jgi:kynurenine formamidase